MKIVVNKYIISDNNINGCHILFPTIVNHSRYFVYYVTITIHTNVTVQLCYSM